MENEDRLDSQETPAPPVVEETPEPLPLPEVTRERNPLWTYMATAIVGAVIGGLLVTVALPTIYSRGYTLPRAQARVVLPEPSAGAQPPAYITSMPAVTVSQKLDPAVVGISNTGAGTDLFGRRVQRTSSGSGFVISREGYIVTNNHVVDGANELTVSFSDGRQAKATVVGTDQATDLAVIKVLETGLTVAELGNSDQLRVGETVIAIGNPLGTDFQRSVTQGIVSGMNRLLQVGDQKLPLIQTDAVINPGNSGGPLSNVQGQVIGITTLKLNITAVEGMGFAIPINTARPIVQELIANGRVQRPYLGVYLIDKTNAAQYNVKLDKGVYVADLVQNGPAARAGIRKADIITAIGGNAVNSADELKSALQKFKVGQSVEVSILRNNAGIKINVTLGETPQAQTK